MKLWLIITVTLFICLISSAAFTNNKIVRATGDVYVGITFGGTTVEEAKQLIDKVNSYTNLFIVDSWTINGGPNGSALTEICDYAIQKNMYFMVYFNFIFLNYSFPFVPQMNPIENASTYNYPTWDDYGMTPWHRSWLNEAEERYGDWFLGAYLYDEPGGKQIDCGYWNKNNQTFAGTPIKIYQNVSTYDDAARIYVSSIIKSGSMQALTNSSYRYNLTSPVPVFTADYALYWFDYKVGYEAVFVELGNGIDEKGKMAQIALCRGAATAHNKEWGAIVVLATDNPPTPQDGATILKDMTMAYEAGAKYILVFDYAMTGQGSLTNEHFNAIKQFWNNIQASPQTHGKYSGQVALVLPTNYGWGLRHLSDKIWGFWPADNQSAQIWGNLNQLVNSYGLNLDIIYNDSQVSTQEIYSQTYLWNSTLSLNELSFSDKSFVLVIILGSVGAATCISTYWVTKRRKNGAKSAVFC